ncbi:hypothetical protein [uncultured Clostridium sp.]|jgi:hypothetical protein|uniref:hypothetical protein n=1 Tax=uncultured Clostridium sp. TaxID=59620 RepID=UPI0026204425|nr:hypothetical protein [uncultured Clostridium sp.]
MLFGRKKPNIEERYTEFKVEKVADEILDIRHILKVKGDIIASVTIDKDKTIKRNDYVSSEDLRFLLLQIIDEYEVLKYTGEELCMLEFGINTEYTNKLCEDIIIDRASILDTKSFQYKENVEIGNTLI